MSYRGGKVANLGRFGSELTDECDKWQKQIQVSFNNNSVDKMHATGNSVTGFVLFLVLQIIFVIVFAALGRYGKELLPPTTSSIEGGDGEAVSIMEVTQSKYPRMFSSSILVTWTAVLSNRLLFLQIFKTSTWWSSWASASSWLSSRSTRTVRQDLTSCSALSSCNGPW